MNNKQDNKAIFKTIAKTLIPIIVISAAIGIGAYEAYLFVANNHAASTLSQGQRSLPCTRYLSAPPSGLIHAF